MPAPRRVGLSVPCLSQSTAQPGPAPPRWGEALPSPDAPSGLPGSCGELSPRFICTEDAEAEAGEDLFSR